MKGRKYGGNLTAMAQKRHIMEDKEVGELWVLYSGREQHWNEMYRSVPNLIRKLVEERAMREAESHGEGCKCFTDPMTHVYSALEDFGIDPETWK